MNNQLVDIKFHGHLGENIGEQWRLAICSVGEAIRAIEVLSNHKLYQYLYNQDKNGAKYRVLINGRDFTPPEKDNLIEKPESVLNSELAVEFKNGSLKTIDVVPIIEGSGGGAGGSDKASWATIILGASLIILAIILIVASGGIATPASIYLITIGVGLIAAGVMNLLMKKPDFGEYETIKNGRQSYLFNGPYNTTDEGGPVPVGYGRLLVGSQTISASYDIAYTNNPSSSVDTVLDKGDMDINFNVYIYSELWNVSPFLGTALEADKIYIPYL